MGRMELLLLFEPAAEFSRCLGLCPTGLFSSRGPWLLAEQLTHLRTRLSGLRLAKLLVCGESTPEGKLSSRKKKSSRPAPATHARAPGAYRHRKPCTSASGRSRRGPFFAFLRCTHLASCPGTLASHKKNFVSGETFHVSCDSPHRAHREASIRLDLQPLRGCTLGRH